MLDELRTVVGTEPVDENRSRGSTLDRGERRAGLFGGQVLAQCLSACGHTLPSGSVPDSLHANLLRSGNTGDPVEYRVERVRDGRNLQHREVRGYQDDELIIQATVVSSTPADGLDWQYSQLPVVGPANTSDSAAEPWAAGLGAEVFTVAHPTSDDAGPSPSHPLWLRCRTELPADPWLHGAVFAFWSDFGMNWSVRSTHHQLDDLPAFSVSATHSLWFHRLTRTDDWHLLSVQTQSLAGSQGFVSASIFDGDGALAASIAQGVFIRTS